MPLHFRKTLKNKAEISVWHVTETEDELRAMTSVPTDEMEEINFIRSESQRKQKLAVRALLNEVFEEKMYLNHHDNGKPYLENSVYNISITHTDNFVAIITHDEEDLGIDVESLDRDFSAVEKKALSEEEILAYVESGEPMDKAGAYGIQGKAGVFVSKIEGAFDTVVGLSGRLVEKLLSEAEENV